MVRFGAGLGLAGRSVVALSLEGTDLRVLCARGRAVERWLSVPLDPALLPLGTGRDPAAFGQAVRSILSEHEVPRGRVVAGFPATHALSCLLSLPPMPPATLRDVLRREAKRVLWVDSAEYHLFHQVVEEASDHVRIFLIAVRREALDAYLSGLRLANVVPQMVELRPLAMVRAISQPHIIISNAERSSLDVIIVSNSVPVVMRSLLVEETDVAGACGLVVDELERTIASYNDSNRDRPLSPRLAVALTGELSAEPDLHHLVRERLGRPVAALSCPLSCPQGFPVANFVVNAGLVLKAL